MRRWIVSVCFFLATSAASADDGVRGCYGEEHALEILSEMGAVHVRGGLGGTVDGTPEWWDLPGGGWVLTMITDADQSRCIVDYGDRRVADAPGIPAYLFLKEAQEGSAEPEIIR